MAQAPRDWNVPGIGVGVVVKDQLVFAKGYGYRDYGKKIPYTPKTTLPIASNTKLFTAVAAGLLVEEGKLDWDKPIRKYVPSDQVLQRRAGSHGDHARHAVAPYRRHAARPDLVQVGLHPEGSVRAAEIPRALGAASHDVPLQQHDVLRRRLRDRALVGQAVGDVRHASESCHRSA